MDENTIEVMDECATTLADLFEGSGYALLVFDKGPGGESRFVSNVVRADMIAALKELIIGLEKGLQ